MRISGGVARGIPLVVPKGDAVRPATDALRQAVFSSLAAAVPDAFFWDLFAGSGAYGLEALSRGAGGGIFVEKNAKAVTALRQNIASVCKSAGRDPAALSVIPTDALTWTPSPAHPGSLPDLVFIDPPYDLIEAVATGLFARLTDLLAGKPEAVVLFEMPGEMTLEPAGWTCLKRLGKGGRQPTAALFRKTVVV